MAAQSTPVSEQALAMSAGDIVFHRIPDARAFLVAPSAPKKTHFFGGFCALCAVEHRIACIQHHAGEIKTALSHAVPGLFQTERTSDMITAVLVEDSQGQFGFVVSNGSKTLDGPMAPPIQVGHGFIQKTRGLLTGLDNTSAALETLGTTRLALEARLKQQRLDHERSRKRARLHYQAQKHERTMIRNAVAESSEPNSLSPAELDRWSMEEADRFRALKRRLRAEAEPLETRYETIRTEIAELKANRRELSQALKSHFYSAFKSPSPPSKMTQIEQVLHHAAYFGYVPHGIAQFCVSPRAHPFEGPLEEELMPDQQTELLCGLSFKRRRIEPFQTAPPPLTVIFEDNYLVVINKPSGLLSASGRHWTTADNAQFRLSAQLGCEMPVMLVHRLDQDTSGLMVFAKEPKTHRLLSAAFMERKVEKNYIAVVDGTPTETTGVIDLPLATNRAGRPRQVVDLVSGKPSRTEYQVMGQTRQGTALNLVPITGRTHQLRVHCAHPTGLSCPIIGDDLYGISPPSTRLLLHANRIKFNHPITQNTVELEAHPTFV
ncbi:MAG: pseudouridine synthase [Myxococcota bacterium]|nr:pseudouridine synthase [Myxococcota bacterium]